MMKINGGFLPGGYVRSCSGSCLQASPSRKSSSSQWRPTKQRRASSLLRSSKHLFKKSPRGCPLTFTFTVPRMHQTTRSTGKMARRIYFAGSIRAGRDDAKVYAEIVAYLKNYGKVLTEHVGDPNMTEAG